MNIERFEGTGRMSRAVRHNGMLYLCGQTDTTAADVQGQAKNVLAKIEDLLNKYGSDKDHILTATIYVKTMNDFAAMNEIWDAWVNNGHEPARACVQAEMARPEILVEIVVAAAVKE